MEQEFEIVVGRFYADINLLYSIQIASRQSTAKILGYFNNLALNIAEDYFSKKPKRHLNKTMKWTYDGCGIPFALTVYGGKSSSSKQISVNVQIKPSMNLKTINVATILNQDAEYQLGLDGATPVGTFIEPVKKAPPAIKKMFSDGASLVKSTKEEPHIDIKVLPEELRKKYGL